MAAGDGTELPALGRETPLYEVKANLFKALAHPVRIKVLDALAEPDPGTPDVHELATTTGFEEHVLAQHLSVLRRHGAVHAVPSGGAARYRLAHPRIAELLGVARAFLQETGGHPAPAPRRRPSLEVVRDADTDPLLS